MYEGFPSRADEGRMWAFHAGSWPERAVLTETFEDDRLRELGRRIVFLREPGALNDNLRARLAVWLQNRREGREGVKTGRSIGQAVSELKKILSEFEPSQLRDEVESWMQRGCPLDWVRDS